MRSSSCGWKGSCPSEQDQTCLTSTSRFPAPDNILPFAIWHSVCQIMQSSAKNSEIHNSNQKLVLHMWEDSGQSFLKSKFSKVLKIYKFSWLELESEWSPICMLTIIKEKIFKKKSTWLFDGNFSNLVTFRRSFFHFV